MRVSILFRVLFSLKDFYKPKPFQQGLAHTVDQRIKESLGYQVSSEIDTQKLILFAQHVLVRLSVTDLSRRQRTNCMYPQDRLRSRFEHQARLEQKEVLEKSRADLSEEQRTKIKGEQERLKEWKYGKLP